MNKKDAIYTQWNITQTLKGTNPVIMITWMYLEGIMLSEISQMEKDKCSMISLTCRIF